MPQRDCACIQIFLLKISNQIAKRASTIRMLHPPEVALHFRVEGEGGEGEYGMLS